MDMWYGQPLKDIAGNFHKKCNATHGFQSSFQPRKKLWIKTQETGHENVINSSPPSITGNGWRTIEPLTTMSYFFYSKINQKVFTWYYKLQVIKVSYWKGNEASHWTVFGNTHTTDKNELIYAESVKVLENRLLKASDRMNQKAFQSTLRMTIFQSHRT